MLSQQEINELIDMLLPEKKVFKYSLVIMPKDAEFRREDGGHWYDRWTRLPSNVECVTFTPHYPQSNARDRKDGPSVNICYYPTEGFSTDVTIYKSGNISFRNKDNKDFVLDKLDKLINDPNFKIEKIDLESENCTW